jgi:hypothetical protein
MCEKLPAYWRGLLVALPVWWFLLFLGPISFILRFRRVLTRSGLFALITVYAVFLSVVLGLNAEAYRLYGNVAFTAGAFLKEVVIQLVQPITWHQPW